MKAFKLKLLFCVLVQIFLPLKAFSEIDCFCEDEESSSCIFNNTSLEQLNDNIKPWRSWTTCRDKNGNEWNKENFKKLSLENYSSKLFPKVILKLDVNELIIQNSPIDVIDGDTFSDLDNFYWDHDKIINLSFGKLTKLNLESFLKIEKYYNSKLYVNLDHNEISEIESSLNASIIDQFLSFSFNRLKNVEIGNSVKSLNFSFNEISEIYCREIVFGVEFLDLSHNVLTKSENFYDCMARLDNLKALNLSFNDLGTVKENEEPLRLETFTKLTKLEELSLVGNNISYIPYGLFSELSNLEFLDLSHNKLKRVNFKTFLPLVDLITLDMSHNNFYTTLDFLPIKTFLTKIENLGLEGVNFSCECLGHLITNLRAKGVSILRPKKFVRFEPNINGLNCFDRGPFDYEEYCEIDYFERTKNCPKY